MNTKAIIGLQGEESTLWLPSSASLQERMAGDSREFNTMEGCRLLGLKSRGVCFSVHVLDTAADRP